MIGHAGTSQNETNNSPVQLSALLHLWFVFHCVFSLNPPICVSPSLQETPGRGGDPHRNRHRLSQPFYKRRHWAGLQLPDPHLLWLRQDLQEGGQGGGAAAEQAHREGVTARSLRGDRRDNQEDGEAARRHPYQSEKLETSSKPGSETTKPSLHPANARLFSSPVCLFLFESVITPQKQSLYCNKLHSQSHG